jgi:hypothetical protein
MPLQTSLYNLEMALRAALYSRKQAPRKAEGLTDIFLCLVDHFEPHVGQPADSVARERMLDWMQRYPAMAKQHQDAEGRAPAHSFFYPYDEFDAWEFSQLVELCAAGYGEIDLHLHHHDDTSDSLRKKFQDAITLYQREGVFPCWPDGRPAWSFIHGNWALDNSRSDGGRNYCGVNNELTLLAQEGCYADFTFPAWLQTAQPRQLNSIYYATDDPERPKSYDRGVAVRAGVPGSGTLLLIQGPLVPFLKSTRRGPRLAIDDGDLASYRRYSPERLDRWVRTAIHVEGRPDRIFIKLHCHGAADANRQALLGQDLDALYGDASRRYNDGTRYRMHYVTAREMYNVVKATEANSPLSIAAARDFLFARPTFKPSVV